MTHYLLFKKEHEDNGSIRDGLFYLTRRDILETAITQADEGREFVKPSLRTLCYAHGRNTDNICLSPNQYMSFQMFLGRKFGS